MHLFFMIAPGCHALSMRLLLLLLLLLLVIGLTDKVFAKRDFATNQVNNTRNINTTNFLR